MPLPSRTTILKMDFVYKGQPYVRVASAKSQDLNKLDFVYKAEPLWGLNWNLSSMWLAFIMRLR